MRSRGADVKEPYVRSYVIVGMSYRKTVRTGHGALARVLLLSAGIGQLQEEMLGLAKRSI